MAKKDPNAVEIDVELLPHVKRVDKVGKELEAALNKAVRPLVDTLKNVKVGLDKSSLQKAQADLEALSQRMQTALATGRNALIGEDGKPLVKTAQQLEALTRSTPGVRQFVDALGGYKQAADILSGPNATKRLDAVTKAFSQINDTAYQLSRIPALDAKTNNLLTKLYKSPDNFAKLSSAQQEQVRQAMAVLRMQDEAMSSLSKAMRTAGFGKQSAELAAQLRERSLNAGKLRRATDPRALEQQRRREERAAANAAAAQQRMERAAARSRAISEEKDRTLRRVGGIQNVRDPQDVRMVKAGLNRDLNMALERAAIARVGPGGMNSKPYREAIKEVDSIKAMRAQLDAALKQQADVLRQQNTQRKLNEKADMDAWRERERQRRVEQRLREKADMDAWREEGRRLLARRKLNEKADLEEWRERGRQMIRQRRLNEKADLEEYNRRHSTARQGASFAEAQRLIQAAGGIRKLTDKLGMDAVGSGLRARERRLTQDIAVAQVNKQDTSRLLAELEALRGMRRELEARRNELRTQQRQETVGSTSNRVTPRNLQQAREILRASGGDLTNLSRADLRTVRPYLEDRYRARSRYAEGVAGRQGVASPEYARAAASAREYAAALEQLNQRAAQLRPQISDLGQVIRQFFRYALGYGALYQMLGAITALGRGLVDLDEQFYNIKAITLSTDEQMRTIEGAIKQVGLTTKFTLNEIAEAAKVLAQAGTMPEQIPQQLRAVADFAAATGTQLQESADLLTSFRNVYKDISDGKAADLMTKALNLSKLQGSDLKTIISYTAQTAEGYNISAEQLLGAVATLRNVGIKPSTVATGLRQAMLEVFNPDAKLLKALKTRYAQMGEEMSEAAISGLYNSFTFADNPLLAAITELKRIGFGGEASSLFSRAFDVRAFNPLQALVNNFDQYSSLTAQVGIGRSATEASRIQMESLRATLENLGAAVVAFSDSVGGDMVRNLQSAAKAVTDLVLELTELDTKLKMESGQGLGSTVTQSLLGGVLGAMLGGKGFLRRGVGFASGAYLGGSMEYNSVSPEGSAMDNALPAALAAATFAPTLIDLFSRFGRRKGEILSAKNRVDAAGKSDVGGTLMTAVAGADLITSLASLKLPGGLSKFKGMAAGALGKAGLVGAVLGALYGAYELYQWFAGSDVDGIRELADKQRVRAGAAGDFARKLTNDYEEQQNAIDEYRIDPLGRAKAATTAAQAVAMRQQVESLELAKAQILGAAAADFAKVREMLTEYNTKDFDARKTLLNRINQELGTSLSDQQAAGLSSQLEALKVSAEGVRKALGDSLARAADEMRAALYNQDLAGVERAGIMQRVVDSMPDLKAFLHNQADFTAEQVSAMYVEFNKRMAEETSKGTIDGEKRLAAAVEAASQMIVAQAIEMGDSTLLDTAMQQIVGALAMAEKESARALELLATDLRQKAADLRQQAAEDMEQAEGGALSWMPWQVRQGLSNAVSAIPGGDVTARFLGWDIRGMSPEGERKAREAAQRKLEAADAAERRAAENEQAAIRAREKDVAEAAKARAQAREVEQQAARLASSGRFSEEFLSTLTPERRQLLSAIQDPEARTALVRGGKFKPVKERDGVYAVGQGTAELQQIITQLQNWETQQAETSKQKQREAAMAPFLSDPKVMVEIAKLQNAQRAAERHGNLGQAQDLARQIFDLQFGEQQKAVERARLKMEEAKGGDKSDATAATLTYHSELAKLESMRGELADKIDEYSKKVADRDLKRQVVETELAKKALQKQFSEAVARGDIDKAKEASDEYVKVQEKLTDLAKRELAAKGYSPEQIEMEVRLREDLTTALIDQESAQRSLTQAVMQQADFMLRQAGTGPTTGDKALDGFLNASGIGFTKEQEISALQRDMGIYQQVMSELESKYAQQRADLSDQEKIRVLDREYIEKLDELRQKVGETSAELQMLTMTFDEHAYRMFDPSQLLTKMQASQNDLRNISATVQDELVNAFDNLGESMATAITNAEDLGDAIKAVIHQTANSIFTKMFTTGFNYLGQQGLRMLGGSEANNAGTAQQGLFGQALGALGGGGESGGGLLSGVLGGLFGGNDAGDKGGSKTKVGQMVVNANSVTVTGSVLGAGGENPLGGLLGASQNQTLPAANTGEEAGSGFFGGIWDSVSGMFGGIADTFKGAVGNIKNMFSGMFGGSVGGNIGSSMKTGDWAKLIVSLVGSAFGGMGGAAGGAASGAAAGAAAFADGGVPSRVIEGKRSAKRDNLTATATVGGQRVPINVEAGEGILSRKAMSLIGGEAGLNALNSGSVPMFSQGGMPSSSYNAGQPVTTGQEHLRSQLASLPESMPNSQGEINIANIYSEQGFADFVTSRAGRRVIINELRKAGVIS